MPVKKCSNGKWRIGDGPCIYTTKENADKAYEAYLAKKHSGGKWEYKKEASHEKKTK